MKTLLVIGALLVVSEAAVVGKGERIDWGPIECDACKDVFGYICHDLLSPDVVSAAVAGMEKMCNIITNADQKQQCQRIVQQYGTLMFEAIRTALNPSTFCPLITMCPKNSTKLQRENRVDWGPIGCDACKMVFGYICEDLLSGDVEQTAIMEMRAVCYLVPNQDQREQCMQIVEKYGAAMFTVIKSYLNPDYFCPLITACPKPTVVPTATFRKH